MRFVSVVIKNFQCIEHTEVAFGPGLNVVFGPNDLGKSTLVTAIRAALLVPPTSSEAGGYATWYADAAPEVTLTFVDDDQRAWQVRKSFGSASGRAAAELYFSKDGVQFDRECGGREVEDRLRKLLAWGIASPGGKGAPRGLPTSFLAQVLLADQAAVQKVFGQSLDADFTSSGKDRLQQAFAALAEDPRFKAVLDEVQERIDDFFTSTGQKKRGRSSPFTAAADEINRHGERVEALKKSVAESQSVEARVRALREELATARAAQAEAAAELDAVRRQWARSLQRGVCEADLAQARAAVDALERQASEIAERERALAALGERAAAVDTQVAVALAAVHDAEAGLHNAEKTLRSAASEDGAPRRALAKAKLGEERAELAARAARTQLRIDALETARQAAAAARAKDDAQRQAFAGAHDAATAQDAAERAFAEAATDVALARALLAYGQWRDARDAADRTADARATAGAARTEAASHERVAQESESLAAEQQAKARTLRSRLPDSVLHKRIEELAQKIEIAEAALGGGFSVTLRGSAKVPVHLSADGETVIEGTVLDGRFVTEANRSASLGLGDLLAVDIVAGGAEKRRALEALQQQWANEASPILDRAGVATLAELRERLGEAAALETAVESHRARATQSRLAADAKRQSAAMLEQRADELAERSREVDALQGKLEAFDLDAIAPMFAELGPGWKAQADALIATKERAHSAARKAVDTARLARERTQLIAAQAKVLADEAAAEAARRRDVLGLPGGDTGGDDALARLLADANAEANALALRQAAVLAELEALDRQASSAIGAAQTAVEDAKAAQERALEQHAHEIKARDDARSALDKAYGETAARKAAFDREDHAAVRARLAEASERLAQYENDSVVTSEDVESAERRETDAKAKTDQVRADLQHAEGALTKVGGQTVEEELEREREALEIAKERQRELEIDAESWKLLGDTLKSAEKDGRSHLGRSLALPVSMRLQALSESRYSGIRIDQHLNVERVDVTGVKPENALEELSVGTRDQLATLIRLTIAEQLKSAIILDDHLVHTDPDRLDWFRGVLRSAARNAQVVVVTCRPQDYLALSELPRGRAARDIEEGAVRAIDYAKLTTRFGVGSSRATAAARLGAAAADPPRDIDSPPAPR